MYHANNGSHKTRQDLRQGHRRYKHSHQIHKHLESTSITPALKVSISPPLYTPPYKKAPATATNPAATPIPLAATTAPAALSAVAEALAEDPAVKLPTVPLGEVPVATALPEGAAAADVELGRDSDHALQ